MESCLTQYIKKVVDRMQRSVHVTVLREASSVPITGYDISGILLQNAMQIGKLLTVYKGKGVANLAHRNSKRSFRTVAQKLSTKLFPVKYHFLFTLYAGLSKVCNIYHSFNFHILCVLQDFTIFFLFI